MLWPVNNDTGRRTYYCGPAAVAALTGTPVTRVEKMLRRVRDDRNRKLPAVARKKLQAVRRKGIIRGTSGFELFKVLERLGACVEPYPLGGLKTLGQFVDDTQHMPGAFLVQVTGHWVAVSSGHVSETLNGGQVLWVERDRRRVRSATRVYAPATPRAPTGIKPRSCRSVLRDTTAAQPTSVSRTPV